MKLFLLLVMSIVGTITMCAQTTPNTGNEIAKEFLELNPNEASNAKIVKQLKDKLGSEPSYSKELLQRNSFSIEPLAIFVSQEATRIKASNSSDAAKSIQLIELIQRLEVASRKMQEGIVKMSDYFEENKVGEHK